ncbi:MAG: DUF2690 domain-containing protein [Chloroflexi bacterium]|nr:MAG: DUF2690 domain-containing protein [Chloroflexota bacterium]
MRRFFPLLIGAVLVAALFVGTAYASVNKTNTNANVSTTPHLLPRVTCSGDGCNGLDPEQAGCAADAYTVKVSGGKVSFRTGYVELRYSPTCGTNWARVISTVGNAQLTVSIRRKDGLFYFSVGSGTRLWSPMVSAVNVKAKGCGSANHYEDCTESI